MTWFEAKRAAQDRQQWKTIVDALCPPWDKEEMMMIISEEHNGVSILSEQTEHKGFLSFSERVTAIRECDARGLCIACAKRELLNYFTTFSFYTEI